MYLDKCNKQIEEIVELVRGKLTKMARITLGALIVIDVHGKITRTMVCFKRVLLNVKGRYGITNKLFT